MAGFLYVDREGCPVDRVEPHKATTAAGVKAAVRRLERRGLQVLRAYLTQPGKAIVLSTLVYSVEEEPCDTESSGHPVVVPWWWR